MKTPKRIRMSMDVGARIMLTDKKGDYCGYVVVRPTWYHKLKRKFRNEP